MLRYSVHLKSRLSVRKVRSRPIPEPLSIEWWKTTPHFASLPKAGNENIKYLISPSGNRIHNLSDCSRTHVPLRTHWPLELYNIYNKFHNFHMNNIIYYIHFIWQTTFQSTAANLIYFYIVLRFVFNNTIIPLEASVFL